MLTLPPALRVGLGLSMATAGLLMLVLPGPGLLTLAAAARLLATDLPFLRPLDASVTRLFARLSAPGTSANA
jgi:hypothetical protein